MKKIIHLQKDKMWPSSHKSMMLSNITYAGRKRINDSEVFSKSKKTGGVQKTRIKCGVVCSFPDNKLESDFARHNITFEHVVSEAIGTSLNFEYDYIDPNYKTPDRPEGKSFPDDVLGTKYDIIWFCGCFFGHDDKPPTCTVLEPDTVKKLDCKYMVFTEDSSDSIFNMRRIYTKVPKSSRKALIKSNGGILFLNVDDFITFYSTPPPPTHVYKKDEWVKKVSRTIELKKEVDTYFNYSFPLYIKSQFL